MKFTTNPLKYVAKDKEALKTVDSSDKKGRGG